MPNKLDSFTLFLFLLSLFFLLIISYSILNGKSRIHAPVGKSGIEPLGDEVLDLLWKRGTPEANGFFLSTGDILVADLRNIGLTLSL